MKVPAVFLSYLSTSDLFPEADVNVFVLNPI